MGGWLRTVSNAAREIPAAVYAAATPVVGQAAIVIGAGAAAVAATVHVLQGRDAASTQSRGSAPIANLSGDAQANSTLAFRRGNLREGIAAHAQALANQAPAEQGSIAAFRRGNLRDAIAVHAQALANQAPAEQGSIGAFRRGNLRDAIAVHAQGLLNQTQAAPERSPNQP